MHALIRMLLLFLVALGLAMPVAGSIGVDGEAVAATRPCPSKPVVKACVIEAPSDAIAPRGTATADASCSAKAIGAEPGAPAAPTTCGTLAFDTASVSWSGWSPPTPARPPRS